MATSSANCRFASLVRVKLKTSKVEKAKADFLSLRPCCLDPYWSKPAQARVKTGELDFLSIVQDYFSSLRPVSLREEQNHTIQRVISGGEATKALIASRQRSQSVVYSLKRCFMTRGGRDLDKAPRKTSSTYLRLRKKGKVVHRRPKQMGNTMLYFVNCQVKRGGTKEEHIATWKGMTEEARAWWRTRHHNHVRLRRSQHEQEAKARSSASASGPIGNCSSWGLGCQEWPLKPEAVKAWLLQFHGKQRGLETLKKFDSPECKSYVEAVEAGTCTYHMKDAIVLLCNTFLGDEVSHDVVKECGLTQSIVSSELLSPGCHSVHPGRCKTRDKELCSALDALWACMPKMSCVVRLQCGKFQVYCRSVLGMEEKISKNPIEPLPCHAWLPLQGWRFFVIILFLLFLLFLHSSLEARLGVLCAADLSKPGVWHF